MKHKTSELSGSLLDAAVAKAECIEVAQCRGGYLAYAESARIHAYSAKQYSPSTDWAQGGPLIEREEISLICPLFDSRLKWIAGVNASVSSREALEMDHQQEGETALIAAMRCFVASKLGDEVDL
ncbi:DUF2591 domain-containing protein [Hydrogenophaga sp. D2P1]|uniref:DUF2591 domain-containing protein n=1 Tax=Hydrogenophaga aromaticivorans TaxID=2610898 RepID=A0A7Y8KWE5_9BURK|nr:phage protein NinX family protein [Hydrogenophaga aromaticivorans]NWF45390.1 DUF2591 domain-containing protein [Hydrogenophaga aromaticivorans]